MWRAGQAGDINDVRPRVGVLFGVACQSDQPDWVGFPGRSARLPLHPFLTSLARCQNLPLIPFRLMHAKDFMDQRFVKAGIRVKV